MKLGRVISVSTAKYIDSVHHLVWISYIVHVDLHIKLKNVYDPETKRLSIERKHSGSEILQKF